MHHTADSLRLSTCSKTQRLSGRCSATLRDLFAHVGHSEITLQQFQESTHELQILAGFRKIQSACNDTCTSSSSFVSRQALQYRPSADNNTAYASSISP
jgi:hypothetical protein